MCGEKTFEHLLEKAEKGSPPRVRGKGCVLAGRVGAQGITPACAGKSGFNSHPYPVSWDHPRMCGEKGITFRNAMPYEGSPPHVRGKVPIFPGYICDQKDHPRMCGEKAFSHSSGDGSKGSPPHVRGKD